MRSGESLRGLPAWQIVPSCMVEEATMLTKRELLRSSVAAAIASVSFKPDRMFAQTTQPGFFVAQDIAEEGFIYGLPIAMNYAVMYEYAI